MENKILIDWLTITSKSIDVDGFKKLLGLESVPWMSMKGYYGYRSREYYESISIHYDGTRDMGVCLEMSGQGCRAFESLSNGDFETLFKRIIQEESDLRVTRLDVAYDDHIGILDIEQIVSDSYELKCAVTPFRSWCTTCSNKGKSVDIGSKQSSVLIRIYDKAAERGFKDERHWVRVELQMRDNRALEFLKIPLSIGERYFNVICNYLCYVTPNENDSNKSRWELRPYWEKFLDNASAISLYVKPGMEYNLNNVDNFIFRNAANAIDCALECYGLTRFLEKIKNREVRQNPKYTRLIEQYKNNPDAFESLVESSLLDNSVTENKSLYMSADRDNEFKRNLFNKKDIQ